MATLHGKRIDVLLTKPDDEFVDGLSDVRGWLSKADYAKILRRVSILSVDLHVRAWQILNRHDDNTPRTPHRRKTKGIGSDKRD